MKFDSKQVNRLLEQQQKTIILRKTDIQDSDYYNILLMTFWFLAKIRHVNKTKQKKKRGNMTHIQKKFMETNS